MGKELLIKNGYIVDPDTGYEGISDLLIRDGLIAARGPHLTGPEAEEIDASGLVVMPGAVDLHVHLRDPGQTWKEDIVSGGEAAARGGVTSVLAMPNTTPPMDRVHRIDYVVNKAKTETGIHVYQSAAITENMRGEKLVDIEELADFGVKAFSEDGKSVMNSVLMQEAMRRIAARDLLICDHCEDIGMVRGGVMNQDENAERLGLPGITNSVEDVIAARDAILAAECGARIHLCHCSTYLSAEIVRTAKKLGAVISAEVCPHHFTLTSDDIPCDDANYKMNPPLRARRDVEALKEALADGTIEVISTDHAPHSRDEKRRGFRESPFGITGLETSVALTYTELVKTKILTLMQMAEKMSYNPARILKVPGGSLKTGSVADIAIFDFETPYIIDPDEFVSKGKNTPFAGREVFGRNKYTIVNGHIIRKAEL